MKRVPLPFHLWHPQKFPSRSGFLTAENSSNQRISNKARMAAASLMLQSFQLRDNYLPEIAKYKHVDFKFPMPIQTNLARKSRIKKNSYRRNIRS